MAQIRATLEELIGADRSGEAIDLMLEILTTLQRENASLSQRLAKQLKARFGQTSERIEGSQLSLFLSLLGADEDDEDAEQAPADPDATGDDELDEHFANKRKRKSARRPPGRRPLPPELPRDRIVIPVAAEELTCPRCGTEKECFDHATSEVLEWTPGHFKVLEYAREKRSCKACAGEVSIAPVADKVIERGMAGPGLLTEIMLKKFKYAQPLWRQAHFFATCGVRLAESTMCDWVRQAAELLQPIYRELLRKVLASHCINTDDSHIRVLDREHPKRIKRGVMWVYIGDQKYVFFDYTPNRSREGPLRILVDFEGLVQADAYSGYNVIFERDGATAFEVGCMMHARRYFVEALDAGEALAAAPLRWIRHIYKVEEYAKDRGANASQRRAIRQRKSKPLMKKLGTWLQRQYERVETGSPIAKAIGYAVRQWDALNRFLDDGAIEIDNGLAERVIRTLAIGRKNYMFAGSDAGAERAAVLYSLIASCCQGRCRCLPARRHDEDR
jgi:transposase